jgi:hypothetical protein
MELQLEKFSPTKAELVRMVEETKGLTLADLADREQLAKITRARTEERERLERDQKDKAEREQREREQRERREREETERLEKEAHYQDFLDANGYTAETAGSFHIARSETEVKLYKLVGTLKIK